VNELYDSIGVGYAVGRRTDPNVAEQLYTHLIGATRIVNVGAGTGSYEPDNVDLVAVEPSAEMISQRKAGSCRVEKAFAESLPFEDRSFSHAMTVLSMHHWDNRELAFAEISRVTTDRFVAITWDPNSTPFWLTRDYFPEIYDMDKSIFPGLEELSEYFDEVDISPLQIPSECEDGFLAAFWKRPEAYLNCEVRQSMSSFSKLDSSSLGLKKLEEDLASGIWKRNNRDILSSSSIDVGYRLISAKVKHS
jgi:SAM-dependent methyltransferase